MPSVVQKRNFADPLATDNLSKGYIEAHASRGPMSNSPDFIAHVVDLVGAAAPAEARRMFGGHGLYVDGLIVGLVVDDTLFLKTDATTRPAFEARGLEPFSFTSRRKGTVSTSYYPPPEEALENRAAMREWLTLALAAARRAQAGKAKRAGGKAGQARR